MASTTARVNLDGWTCQAPHAPVSFILQLVQNDVADQVSSFAPCPNNVEACVARRLSGGDGAVKDARELNRARLRAVVNGQRRDRTAVLMSISNPQQLMQAMGDGEYEC